MKKLTLCFGKEIPWHNQQWHVNPPQEKTQLSLIHKIQTQNISVIKCALQNDEYDLHQILHWKKRNTNLARIPVFDIQHHQHPQLASRFLLPWLLLIAIKWSDSYNWTNKSVYIKTNNKDVRLEIICSVITKYPQVTDWQLQR